MNGVETVVGAESGSAPSKVSWGSVFAGLLGGLSVGVLMFMLGMGITLWSMRPEDLRGATIALMVLLVACTLIGAAVGGWLSGALLGRFHTAPSRRLAGLHGYLAAALGFFLVTSFLGGAIGGTASAVGNTAQTAVGAASQAAGTAGQGGDLASNMRNLLTGLGYPPAQADRMVREAQRSAQGTLSGRDLPSGEQATATATNLADRIGDYVGQSTIVYMVTWLVSLLLAWALGAAGAQRSERTVREPGGRPIYTPTTPQPTGA